MQSQTVLCRARPAALVLMVAFGNACAMPVEDAGVESETEPEIGQISAPIFLGTNAGGVGAVEISFSNGGMCTGFLVGTQMVVTASHCFNSDLPADESNGLVLAKISYAEANGTSWRCVSHHTPSNSKCVSYDVVEVWRLAPKTSAANDLAVVFPASQGAHFWNVSSSDTGWGIFDGGPGSSEPYEFYGNGPVHPDGTGVFTMRKMSARLNWTGADHFITNAPFAPRICRGDSGGPYFLAGGRWAFGVHSSVAELDGHCAEWGTKQRGMKFTELKMTMVNLWRTVERRPLCTQHSPQWPHFWVCP